MPAFQLFSSLLILAGLLLHVSARALQDPEVAQDAPIPEEDPKTWSINRDSSSYNQNFEIDIEIGGYSTILTTRSEYIPISNKELKATVIFVRQGTKEEIKRPCDHPFYLPQTSEMGNFYIDVKPQSDKVVTYVDTSKICLYESKRDPADEIIVPTHNGHKNCCTDTRISMDSIGSPEVAEINTNSPVGENQGGNSDDLFNTPTNQYTEANANVDIENFDFGS